jgi:hypothetical protein
VGGEKPLWRTVVRIWKPGIEENVIFNRAEVRFSLEILTSMKDVILDFGT